jgi:protein-S-isoprenylcysteine O-methyltransferase Ste14
MLAGYAFGFLMVSHLVVLYQEPALRRRFGGEYAAYREYVGRWLRRRRIR